MESNLDKYKNDLNRLAQVGNELHLALQYDCLPQEFEAALKKKQITGPKRAQFKSKLLPFKESYQPWYSEAKAVIKQLLPDRLSDFVRLYEKPKSRKDITYENYTVEDALHGLIVTRGYEQAKVVGPDAAIPLFRQQLSILQSAVRRFESSLFDIRQLVQADLFDSELEIARELANKRFTRAAGAIAGVVLEKHLKEVCENHNLPVSKT